MTQTGPSLLRPVTPDDAPFLTVLMNIPSVLERLNEVPTTAPDWSDAIREWLSDDDEEDYIVCSGGMPIGWLGVNGLLDREKTAYLKMAVFLPDYQGRGLGSRAIQELLGSLKLRGVRQVLLYTDSDNDIARACYQKCGFWLVESLTETMSNGRNVSRVKMETLLK